MPLPESTGCSSREWGRQSVVADDFWAAAFGTFQVKHADEQCHPAAWPVSSIISTTKGGNLMNWDQVKGNWKQFSGKVKQKWGKLTDDDLTVIDGKREQLTGKLQEAYGFKKEQAERELDEFLRLN